jgi:hypothetical protein
VFDWRTPASRFNGLPTMAEAAEAAGATIGQNITWLKPGANEKTTGRNDCEHTP